MMTIKNRVQLIGNLGGAPEVKTLESGNKLAKFAIATNEYYTNKKGEKVTGTQWHNVVVWGKLAGLAEQLLQKGTEVVIDGRINTRDYLDKDGVKKYITEIVANEFLLINRKSN